MNKNSLGSSKRRPARIRSSIMGLGLAGLGLVLSGVAIWFLFARSAAGDSTQPTDFSSIPMKVQFEAPALSLNDLSGVPHSLSDFRGKVVLVNLWATWCPPCGAEMPNLQRYYDKHRDQGFLVIGIEDGDPPAQVASFVEAHRLTFPVWLDPTYEATDRAFKTSNLPASYLVDRTGIVRLMWFGAINEANLEKYLTPLIME